VLVLAALALAPASRARADLLPLTYSVSIADITLEYGRIGDGSGAVTPTAISDVHMAVANPAPSLAPASDPVGGLRFTYSGRAYPGDAYFVRGTVDLLIKVMIGTDSGQFTLREDFANVVSSNTLALLPTLSVLGDDQRIGSELIGISATSVASNVHQRGTSFLVGFEYAAAPEPSSLAIFGLGSIGVAAWAVRRRLRACASPILGCRRRKSKPDARRPGETEQRRPAG
jgi:hypothetical protein